MPRLLRSSKKVELELQGIVKNKKLLPREKEKHLEKSRDLYKVVDENQETLWEEIEKLRNIAGTEEDSSSEEESAEPKSSEESEQGSSGSLAWDNQGDLRSPLKDTSDLLDTSFRFEEDLDSLPPALSRDRSVSVSVNRAKYLTLESGEILDIQPVCRNLNRRFEEASQGESRGLASQDSFLERNLQAKRLETLNLIAEEEEILTIEEEEIDLDTEEERNNEVFVDEEELESLKMDENTYKDHLKKLKSGQRKVKRKINQYTADDVTVADKDEFRNYLKDAKNEFEAFTVAAETVIDLLDSDLEVTRVDEIEAIY